MCGIVGFAGEFSSGLLAAMGEAVASRGPDDGGEVLLKRGPTPVGLAHRRLAIIDLSAAAHQPMTTRCPLCPETRAETPAGSGLWLTYNGEIYNHRELRSELEARGHMFQCLSDSEVLLHLYAQEGVNMLQRLNGIFAFALWDSVRRDLFLARDPIGVKPLYYAETARGFLFASELKALLCWPELVRAVDLDALRTYLTFLWAPGARTLVKGVRKLLPGEAMVVREGRVERRWRYASPPFNQPVARIRVADAVEELRLHLADAVRRQMVADVPVGAFLSGGLDSSTVVYFAREHAQVGLDCFTIGSKGGFEEGFAEDHPYAQRVAQALGVRLDTIWVGPEMADRVEEMVWHLDEPQPDPACLNVLLISEHARNRGIRVLLSGVGGDDLFTGYRRHVALRHESYWTWLPSAVRKAITNRSAHLNHSVPAFRRLARLFAYADADPADRLVSYFFWAPPEVVDRLFAPDARRELAPEGPASMLRETLKELPAGTAPLNQMLYLELRHFLADHNLNYTDKMSMARGVEVRVPLLDLELVDFAARLPVNLKQHGRTGKWILREAMRGLLPEEVITRPKTGFGVPLRRWLRNELKPLVQDVLSEASLCRRGLFDPKTVQALIEADVQGRIDAAYTIFGLVCVELWSRQFLDRVPAHAQPASVR